MHLKLEQFEIEQIASWWKITLDGGKYMVGLTADKSIIFRYLVAHVIIY